VCIIFHAPPAPGNTVRAGVTFHSPNNPAPAIANQRGQLTLGWNAPSATEVDIRIGAPDGPSVGRQFNSGVLTTGAWVADGMLFFLQDASPGKAATAENTLGTVRAAIRL
jgi:hypothetical protein